MSNGLLTARWPWRPRFARRIFVAYLLLALCRGQVLAETPGNVRVYTLADGLRDSLVTAVTVSPRANVWLKHGELSEISWLDGYSVNNLPSPGGGSYRIHESRSAQLWSIYSAGLQEYQGGQWIRYPIPEIRAEFQTNVLRQVRQLPLVPGEREHLLFLLPDRLIEYHAGLNQTKLIRAARSSSLQKFVDMTLARDGGVWITGARGIAKLPGPVRRLSPQSEWREYLLDESLEISDLQRPFEDDQGGVTMVADIAAANKKVLVHFDGESWEVRALPGETIRQGWRDPEQNFWVLTINSLWWIPRDSNRATEKQLIATGQFFDVATEPKGIFWIASNQGLLRYAPTPWRRPVESASLKSFYTVYEDKGDNLWFGGTTLLSFNQDGWRDHPLPPGWTGPIDSIQHMPNGGLLLGGSNQIALFEPESAASNLVAPPAGSSIKMLGPLGDYKVVLRASTTTGTNLDHDLITFDGTNFAPLLPPSVTLKSGFVPECFLALDNGDIWLGGAGGAALYREKQLRDFRSGNNQGPGKTFSLLEAGPGKIWCGEEGRITEYDGKAWSVVRTGLGLVHGMTKSRDGSIWAASSAGLYRFQKNSWVLNDKEDGLTDGALHKVFEDRHGRVWAAGEQGLSLYFPEADIDPPRTFISKADKSNIASTATTFDLVFSGRDKWKFTEASRLLYAYRLDQGVWSPYTNQTTVSFKNLTAGNHQFTVRAMDRNWNEDPEGASFEFFLVVPWYKEWRLVAISVVGFLITLFLAGLAINRHLRLVKSYAEVENIVAERTRELEEANQALLHSQKMKALGALAAGVAHDFNNILSIIRGSAQIIENNLDDKEKVRTRVSRIKTVVDQGTGLVKAMLGFSRIPEKEPVAFDLMMLVEDTLKLLGDRFNKDVHIRLEAERGCPSVQGSKDLLQQILLNLILNAADAMDQRGEIILRLRRDIPPGGKTVLSPMPASGYIGIAVHDSGHGIPPEILPRIFEPPEILPRIFEPFFTTKALSTRRGTGLGLSMVYEIAKQTGYGLMVESVVAQGTTFTILVPVAPRPVPSAVASPVQHLER